MKESWNQGLNIIQSMNLDSALVLSETSLPKDIEAKINGGWIKRLDITVKLEDICHPLFSSDIYHKVGELFKDATVPFLVSFRQVASSNPLAETEVVAHRPQRLDCKWSRTETILFGKLCKHHYKQLIPTCKWLYILVSIVLLDDTPELEIVKEWDQLSENVFLLMRSSLLFEATKIRIEIVARKFRYIIIYDSNISKNKFGPFRGN